MVTPVRETRGMIAGMAPIRQPGAFVFVTCTSEQGAALAGAAVATYREAEGLSLILPLEAAVEAGLNTDMPMDCITLSVHSALDGIGLTAAVATALAQAGIPCNMVAAFHHDHAYVPSAQAQAAMACLQALAASAQSAD